MSIFNLPDKYADPVLMWATLKRDYPIKHDLSHYTVEGEYLQRQAEYVAVPLDTPCPQYPEAILVEHNPTREEGDGIWFRNLYANVPAEDVTYSDFTAIFPGLTGIRIPLAPKEVKCKIVRTYYIVGDVDYPTVEDLPQLSVTNITYGGYDLGFVLGGNFALNGTDLGGYLNDTMLLNGSPALTEYQSNRASDAADASSYSIVVKPGKPERYMGNIWFVEDTYVKAV